jgi:hypothetical protein
VMLSDVVARKDIKGRTAAAAAAAASAAAAGTVMQCALTAAVKVPEAVHPGLGAGHADCCFLGYGNRRLNGCRRSKGVAAGAVALAQHRAHDPTRPPIQRGGNSCGGRRARAWRRWPPRRGRAGQGRRGPRPRLGRGWPACLLQLPSPVNATVNLQMGKADNVCCN